MGTTRNDGGTTTCRRLGAGIGALALLCAGAVMPVASATDTEGFLGTAADLGVDGPSGSVELTQEYASSPTGAWFVELEPRPTSRGGSKAAVTRAERAVLAQARQRGIGVEVRRSFSSLWSGLSATIADEDVVRVRDLPGVVAVHPVLEIEAPEPASLSEPELRTAIAMTGADITQNELGFTGEGIKVGIIDSGVDIDHPDLGGSGVDGATAFPTDKVVAGWDFVGDSFNASASSESYQPVPRPGPVPDDCQGHGTHVAGIVAADGDFADGGVRGVAPDAQLGAYRVFGCEGSTTADIIVAALERSLADGMDVVNQSLGAAFQTWSEYPTAVASDNLVKAGVVVVASIGNSGASGTWSAGAPGVGQDVIGVASFDNTHVMAQVFRVDGDDVPFVPATNAPEPPTAGELPLVALGEPGSDEARACVPVDADVAAGAAVLIERGASTLGSACDPTFYAKALNAQKAGAAAVVLYNNSPGLFSPTVAGTEPITIPVIAISGGDGRALTASITEESTLSWTDEVGDAVNPTGGLISSFSSYGMTADLVLKPDLGAPGGNIYSTYPVEIGRYATLSGTSMSAPHVAGAVALLLEARPDLGAAEVRDVLQNTAVPATWSLVPGVGYVEPVHRQGAGMISVDRAILGTTTITPGKLSLGESEHGPVERTLTVTNTSDADVTYTTSFVDAISTGGTPDDPGFFLARSTVEIPATVTVPAGGSVDVPVSIAPGASLRLAQYGGHLVLTPEDGAPLHVPFAGFAGDYQALPLLGSLPGLPLPALASLTGCTRFIGEDCVAGAAWDLADAGQVYTMRDGDVPTVVLRLEHPARSVTMRVLRVLPDGSREAVMPGRSLASVSEFVGRDSGGFSVRTWDGTRVNERGTGRTAAQNGRYVLEVTAVNALGDAANPAHRETWTSPEFVIQRGKR